MLVLFSPGLSEASLAQAKNKCRPGVAEDNSPSVEATLLRWRERQEENGSLLCRVMANHHIENDISGARTHLHTFMGEFARAQIKK